MWSQPTVCGDIPGARDGHSACVINNCMYVFGGYEEDTDQFSQDVHMLDLKTMEWRYLKTKVFVWCRNWPTRHINISFVFLRASPLVIGISIQPHQ